MVCDRSLAGIVVSIPTRVMDVCFQCCVLCVVSATALSLDQRSLSECGVSERDFEASNEEVLAQKRMLRHRKK